MDPNSTLIGVLQIIVPALLIVGGGAVAYWKFLQEREATRALMNDEERKVWLENRLKFDEASWLRLKETIDIQSARIDALEEEVKKLRQENKVLEQEVGQLRQANEILRSTLRAAGINDV